MKNLMGMVFGRWTVIGIGKKQGHWLCECSCNKKTIREVYGSSLIKKLSTSCGCYRSEYIASLLTKHNEYNLSGEYGIGYTKKGEEFYFDLEDYDKIKNLTWSIGATGYVINSVESVKFHRFILDVKDNEIYDHINRVKYDNRKSNLRLCTNSQNTQNKTVNKNKENGIMGVSWDKSRGKWTCHIMLNYKSIFIGRYFDFEEAVKARLKVEKELFGEFAPQKHLYEKYGIT